MTVREPVHCAIFAVVVAWILTVAFMVHPIACSLIALCIAVERFAEFIYRADQR